MVCGIFENVCGISLSLALCASQAMADTPRIVPVDALKSVYLACERAVQSDDLTAANIRYCSTVYEELKRRAFHGDFKALLRWYKTETAKPVPTG